MKIISGELYVTHVAERHDGFSGGIIHIELKNFPIAENVWRHLELRVMDMKVIDPATVRDGG